MTYSLHVTWSQYQEMGQGTMVVWSYMNWIWSEGKDSKSPTAERFSKMSTSTITARSREKKTSVNASVKTKQKTLQPSLNNKNSLTITHSATSKAYPRTQRLLHPPLAYPSNVFPFVWSFGSFFEYSSKCGYFTIFERDNHHFSQHELVNRMISLQQTWNPLPVALTSVHCNAKTQQSSY